MRLVRQYTNIKTNYSFLIFSSFHLSKLLILLHLFLGMCLIFILMCLFTFWLIIDTAISQPHALWWRKMTLPTLKYLLKHMSGRPVELLNYQLHTGLAPNMNSISGNEAQPILVQPSYHFTRLKMTWPAIRCQLWQPLAYGFAHDNSTFNWIKIKICTNNLENTTIGLASVLRKVIQFSRLALYSHPHCCNYLTAPCPVSVQQKCLPIMQKLDEYLSPVL